MKKNRVFQILYPILIYLLLYNLLGVMFVALFPKQPRLFSLMLAAAITILPIFQIYRRLPVVRNSFDKTNLFREAVMVLFVIALGIVLNIAITATGLTETSEAYANADSILNTGDLWLKILCNVIVIPILEEILFRGCICGQLLSWFSNPLIAILGSAFLFGALHFNMIQFVYGFLMGIAIGFVYYKSRRLQVTFAAHALTNLVVILATLI